MRITLESDYALRILSALATHKEKVDANAVKQFTIIEKAFDMVDTYKQLEGVRYIVTKDDDGADAVKTIYDSVKAQIVAFKNSEDREAVDALIHNELKAHYTHAVAVFEAEEK